MEHFPWAAVSPSVHRILAHSWEVLELNKGFGLGDMSEEGLEALNKIIRNRREHGARKNSKHFEQFHGLLQSHVG